MAVEPFCQGAGWSPRRSTLEPGCCGACGAPLTPRCCWFCPTVKGLNPCRDAYKVNHFWGEARREAIRRAEGQCQRCPYRGELVHYGYDFPDFWRGDLEVNHITPRNGEGYRNGCWHHQEGLEVLCGPCHKVVTAQQAHDRAAHRQGRRNAAGAPKGGKRST